MPRGFKEAEVWRLLAVLKATNRAVAHIEPGDVDHPFLTDSDNKRIFTVVDWTEDLIRLNMYQATGRDLSIPMGHPIMTRRQPTTYMEPEERIESSD
jgi:hypothetical protein